jgi:hypothetical protein
MVTWHVLEMVDDTSIGTILITTKMMLRCNHRLTGHPRRTNAVHGFTSIGRLLREAGAEEL